MGLSVPSIALLKSGDSLTSLAFCNPLPGGREDGNCKEVIPVCDEEYVSDHPRRLKWHTVPQENMQLVSQ